MKAKIIIFAAFAAVALSASAQSDYSSYLNQAMAKLEAGDCEAAQKLYDVYKDLSGESRPSVQVLIDDCSEKTKDEKLYRINDKIIINSLTYKVIYIEDEGKHGFAVCDYGSGPITDDMITERKLPTRSEMKLIYKNRHKIKLTDGYYWTIDEYEKGRNYYLSFYYNEWKYASRTSSNGLLLMYRF